MPYDNPYLEKASNCEHTDVKTKNIIIIESVSMKKAKIVNYSITTGIR